MANRRFTVHFKSAECGIQLVLADRVEVRGEHLVFRNAQQEITALILSDIVERWSDADEWRPVMARLHANAANTA